MKTLHVINSIDKTLGGQVYAALEIARMENLLGIESTVLTSKSDNIDPLFEEYSTIVEFPYSFPKRLYYSKGAVTFYKKNINKFDLIVFHGIWSTLLYKISRIGYINNIPMVLWPHGSIDPFDLVKKKRIKKIIGPLFIKRLLDQLMYLICTSVLEEQKIEKYGARVKTKVAPLPVSYSNQTGFRERFRDKYNFNKKDFVLLFLSRVDYKKGLNLLLPAIKNILKKKKNIKLIIAGTGDKKIEMKVKQWIDEYNLNGTVHCIGFISGQDKSDAFSGSDCFVLPSMNENFGIAVIEALNSGLPVMISTNVYIWNEIIAKNGGWACDYSVCSVSKTIKNIMDDKEDYILKKKSAKMAGSQFLHNNLIEKYQSIYNCIINSNEIPKKHVL